MYMLLTCKVFSESSSLSANRTQKTLNLKANILWIYRNLYVFSPGPGKLPNCQIVKREVERKRENGS